ncbi:hypothetical protein NADFUDRAFT_46775 [Nadsonia fulvescens var. elongata DSM 6958]|uniref:Uncharacterized protein n=1 Tax=Nadsonia fulvescens var. elongata DSM 6958 TaxID=857566 RepID=A0A1E3PHY0_9ASCO|nr:hypothetical protein NADFUDRAFT_46775 [Nadsonia fulvescens var. elongata DSM 6958]
MVILRGRTRRSKASSNNPVDKTPRSRSMPSHYRYHEFTYDPAVLAHHEPPALSTSLDQFNIRDRVQARVRELERYLAARVNPPPAVASKLVALITPDVSPLASKCSSVHPGEEEEKPEFCGLKNPRNLENLSPCLLSSENTLSSHANNRLASLIALYTQDQPIIIPPSLRSTPTPDIYMQPLYTAQGFKRPYESSYAEAIMGPLTKRPMRSLPYGVNSGPAGNEAFSPPLSPKWESIEAILSR